MCAVGRFADQVEAASARDATLGRRVEESGGEQLSARVERQHPRLVHELQRSLPRSRSDLQGRERPAAAPYDLRLAPEREEDAGVDVRALYRDRESDEAVQV